MMKPIIIHIYMEVLIMFTKLKTLLFDALKEIRNWVSGKGLSKIPGMVRMYDLMYDFSFRHFWPYQNIIEIQGSKMYINVNDKDLEMRKTFQAYALKRIHEESTTNLFKKVVKEGDVVVDLGANIGYFTLLAARLVGKKGKVFSFEPEPRNYNYLVKNIELNNYNNVFAIWKAVSDKNGKTKLYICPYDTGHHTINQYSGIRDYRPEETGDKQEFIEIETTTLDDFFKDEEESIDVIKMDVEGAEALVLAGMDRIIKKSKNLKMFIEFFPFLITKMGNSPEEFIRRLLEDYQYSIFVIGQEYSMKKYFLNKQLLRINSYNELMRLCKGEKDHLNLFLVRNEESARSFIKF